VGRQRIQESFQLLVNTDFPTSPPLTSYTSRNVAQGETSLGKGYRQRHIQSCFDKLSMTMIVLAGEGLAFCESCFDKLSM